MPFVLAIVVAWAASPSPASASGPSAEVTVGISGVDSAGCGAASRPCRTIGYALGRVDSGGTVRIGPGWFAENIVVPDGLAVSLIGAGMDITVLNGRQRGTVINSPHDEALDVADLSVVNGVGGADFDGGGITSGGPLTVRRVRLWHNAGDHGGGISAMSSAKVTDSIIADNTARAGGGGIFSYRFGLTIEKSTVSGNRAADVGGGVYALLSPIRVADSTIASNAASLGASGIGVAHGTVRLRHATIAGNQGAAALMISGDPDRGHSITASLFAGNTAGDCATSSPVVIRVADHNVSTDGSCGRQMTAAAIDLLSLAEGVTGTTPTRALGPASTIRGSIPADDPLCDGTDQNGQARRSDLAGGCDPGAHQSTPVPFNLTPPELSGLPTYIDTFHSVGNATTGLWSSQQDPTYHFQWERCRSTEPVCAAIAGATSATYRVVPADGNSRLRVRVTAINSTGISQPAHSAITSIVGLG